MAWRKIDDNKLTEIANSIRSQLRISKSMTDEEMPGLIGDIGIGYIPDYWRSYLAAKATEINSALTAAGENKSAFLWYTDSHFSQNYGQSPMLLKYLSKNTDMQKTFFGGDIAVGKTGELDQITAWHKLVREIPKHHSVIGNHDNQVSELPTAAERAEFFILPERTGDMVLGTDATNGKLYYYIDNHIENTRYICLSTGRMWTYKDEMQWCAEVLNSTPKNWHIVIIGHLWLNYDSNGIIATPENYVQSLIDMFDAYNHRGRGTTAVNSVAYDFANAVARIEFLIGGHVHYDYDFTTATGIPVILTECDSWGERDSVSVATKGTTTENCVYAVIADYGAKAVKVINVGRGATRSVAIPDIVTYTNWAKKAYAGADLTIYNDGKGYKENVRVNSSGTETTATGWDATGLIPCKPGDIIRFKNVEVLDISNDGGSTKRSSMTFFDSSFAKTNNSPSWSLTSLPADVYSAVYGDNGDIIQLTAPSGYGSYAYIRLTCGDINETSIITINEEIGPYVPTVNYTNQIPLAVGFDGAVLNESTTPGYAVNSRYSTSSNKISTLDGTYVTGLIPCTPSSKICMRNISTEQVNEYNAVWIFNLNDTDGNGLYYNDKYTFTKILERQDAFHGVVDENGTIIEFTLPGWQVNQTHFAIGSQYIGPDSIITVNEEID